ncbi:MAG TPA: LecA/PA-IL family lectin [Pyrinomonadaceae bacterium]|nr:LecA/PA-IL family lectin [Pyrinomonadaceae bacterium]
MRKIILAFVLTIMAASFVLADTVYLRDGRRVQGTVLGFINGRFVVRVNESLPATGASTTAIASGDIVFFRPMEIERIEIEGRSLDDARYESRTVDVSLGPNWIDSGVDLRRGQRVQIKATGTIYAGRARITPDGLRTTDPNAPLPRSAEGVLIGTVSNDANAPIVELGLSREFVADRDGRLYLTANRSSYTDARGAFNVEIRAERELRSADDDRDDGRYGRNRRDNPAPVRPRNRSDRYGGDRPGTDNRIQREKTLAVPANLPNGVDTGVELRNGDQVTITASGNVTAGRRAGVVSPEGGRVGAASIIGSYPVPNAGVGALIGFIRTPSGQVTQAFFVGGQLNFAAPADGRLFLLVNDDNYNDNSGSFDVRIVYLD